MLLLLLLLLQTTTKSETTTIGRKRRMCSLDRRQLANALKPHSAAISSSKSTKLCRFSLAAYFSFVRIF